MPSISTLELAIIGLGLLGFAWLVLRARRALELRRLRRRFQRGAEGQEEARQFLRRRGFKIIAEQQVLSARVLVDRKPRDFEVRIDFVVKKRRKIYGVEVKTGSLATDPIQSATRRQLREYSALFPFDDLYLLDMDAQRLMRVRFPDTLVAQRWRGWYWLLLTGFTLGVTITLLVQRLSVAP